VFKGIGGIGSLLRQAGQISSKMEGLNDELRSRRATGSAGGGMVEVEVNGLVEVLRCRIDPALVAQGDTEMLEDLVVGATNQAVGKAKQIHAECLKSMTGGLELPGLSDAMNKFFGGSASAEAFAEDKDLPESTSSE
jgi:DNA-binding YbaB/EbfC family protein